MRAGIPVEAFPQNALVHVQINQPQQILENVEHWIVSTVPEKLLPPQLQSLFASEHPVLTLLGMQSIQAAAGTSLRKRSLTATISTLSGFREKSSKADLH